MKTFQEFLEEGKKRKIKNLSKQIQKEIKKSIKKQQKASPESPPVADYGNPKPGIETDAAIAAMMKRDSEWRKQMKRNLDG